MLLKLVDQEQVIVRTRAHHRALIPAVINLLVVMAVMSFLLGYLSRGTQPAFVLHYSSIASYVVWAGGLLALGIWSLRPLLGWLNRFTFVTSERIVQKNMIGAAQPTVIPLALITQTEVRRSTKGRAAAPGDISVVHGVYGQHQRTRLKDMPDAHRLNTLIAEELTAYRQRVVAHQAAASAPGSYGASHAGRYAEGSAHHSEHGGGHAWF